MNRFVNWLGYVWWAWLPSWLGGFLLGVFAFGVGETTCHLFGWDYNWGLGSGGL